MPHSRHFVFVFPMPTTLSVNNGPFVWPIPTDPVVGQFIQIRPIKHAPWTPPIHFERAPAARKVYILQCIGYPLGNSPSDQAASYPYLRHYFFLCLCLMRVLIMSLLYICHAPTVKARHSLTAYLPARIILPQSCRLLRYGPQDQLANFIGLASMPIQG